MQKWIALGKNINYNKVIILYLSKEENFTRYTKHDDSVDDGVI